MKLSKKQIKYIDHRLENDGIKYWDIRIEIVDHIVSDIEEKLKVEISENEFKEIVQEAFVSLGWKEKFNGGGLDEVFLQRTINYTKSANKRYRKEIKEKITSIKVIISAFLFWIFLFMYQNNIEVIKATFFSIIFFNIIVLVLFLFKYEVFKSIKLNLCLLMATLPLSVFSFLISIPNIDSENEDLSSSYIAIILGIVVPLLGIALNFLSEEFKYSQEIYKKLMS